MANKPRFSLLSKVLYGILVLLILLMFWPTSRTYIQQGLMKLGLFKPKVEVPVDSGSVDSEPSSSITTEDMAIFANEKNESVNTSELKGKVLFINFWATWCGPCVAEMPSIQKLYDSLKGNDNIEFMLVEIEGDFAIAKEFMNKHQLDMPLYIPQSNIPTSWLDGAIPSTVVLDKSGKTVFQHRGMADYSDAEFVKYINQLVSN